MSSGLTLVPVAGRLFSICVAASAPKDKDGERSEPGVNFGISIVLINPETHDQLVQRERERDNKSPNSVDDHYTLNYN